MVSIERKSIPAISKKVILFFSKKFVDAKPGNENFIVDLPAIIGKIGKEYLVLHHGFKFKLNNNFS